MKFQFSINFYLAWFENLENWLLLVPNKGVEREMVDIKVGASLKIEYNTCTCILDFKDILGL